MICAFLARFVDTPPEEQARLVLAFALGMATMVVILSCVGMVP